MSGSKNKTVTATFETREAADLAVEHLVQKIGIERTDVFVQAAGRQNSSGVEASGGDASSANEDGREDATLSGEIEVSADVADDKITTLHRMFGDLGALRVTAK